jgi:hypothetical protein
MEKFPNLNSKLLFQESTYFTSAIRSLSIKFHEILEILIKVRSHSIEFWTLELTWILIQILDWILKIFNRGNCSFLYYLQIHILFRIFWAWVAVFWTNANSNLFENWNENKKIHCSLRPAHTSEPITPHAPGAPPPSPPLPRCRAARRPCAAHLHRLRVGAGRQVRGGWGVIIRSTVQALWSLQVGEGYQI